MSKQKRLPLLKFVLAAVIVFWLVDWGYQTSAASQKNEIQNEHRQSAIFAGGCFWSIERPFEEMAGVIEVETGYTGGTIENPTYEDVLNTPTGHVEAVRVTFDDRKIAYTDLLQIFWRNIDPTDDGGQFIDRGASYVTAIFVSNDEQRSQAEASQMSLSESERFKASIVTPIRDATPFYSAEEYHQNVYKTDPARYRSCRIDSGREAFIKKAWGKDFKYVPKPARVYSKPSEKEIKAALTPLQFEVTQQHGTEPPYRNRYWDLKEDGIYVDIVSGEPLFSSRDKYDSGTGWPSFSRPLVSENLVEKVDRTAKQVRTEIRSKHADSHLGHVFSDGPKPTGLRYCMNSAALKFIPVADLEKEKLGEFSKLFKKSAK